MTASLRLPLAAALALGLAAAPQAQTADADHPNAVRLAAPAMASVDVDDRDPGAAPARQTVQSFEAAVSDQDADARFDLGPPVFAADVSAFAGPLDNGRDGAAPVLRARTTYTGPLDDGRDPNAPPVALAYRPAYDGPLDDGRPEGTRRPAVAADDAGPRVAEAPRAATVVAPEGLALSLVRPNPARDRAELTFTLDAAGSATVRVFDVQGREVALVYDAPSPADAPQAVGFDVSTFAPGTYVAVLSTQGRTMSQTFQVVR